MKSQFKISITLVAALLVTATIAIAQQTAQQPAPALELYHIHVAKAAPGKLTQLIEAYKTAPGPEADEPQVTPFVLRHREGGEWDLITITPLGKQVTISASAPSQAVQDFNQKVAPLTDWHSDTFTVGPSLAVVQKALIAEKGDPVYVVTDYRALPGHRPQLRQVIDRGAQDTPGRNVLFSHVEGASWNFLTITRHDSWAELGAPPPQPAAGTTAQQDQGLALRDHLAVHHDTIALFVFGGQAITK